MPGSTDDWSTPLPPGRDRWRSVAPAVLLAAIALTGVRNHIVREQSSWQGASFGMFATFDNDSSRVVAVRVDQGGGPQRVALPDSFDDDLLELKVAPTEGAADELARDVLDLVEGPATVHVAVRRVVLSGDSTLRLGYDVLVTGEASR